MRALRRPDQLPSSSTASTFPTGATSSTCSSPTPTPPPRRSDRASSTSPSKGSSTTTTSTRSPRPAAAAWPSFGPSTCTVTDGNGLKIEFGHVIENPAIKAIEVHRVRLHDSARLQRRQLRARTTRASPNALPVREQHDHLQRRPRLHEQRRLRERHMHRHLELPSGQSLQRTDRRLRRASR